MDLAEFVSQTLTQIATGVSQAKESVEKLGGQINPKPFMTADSASRLGLVHTDSSGDAVSLVQFDVALTVTQGTGTKGGIGVFAGAISLGSSGQSTAESSSVSRVKFIVPMMLAPTKT
ncbi:MAG: hypothetical protein WDO12_08925 [Pseudomonadota bacterium]